MNTVNGTRFFYLRDKNNHPFGCVAVEVDLYSNTIWYGMSVCHSRADTFERVLGRKIANNRLNSLPFKIKSAVELTNVSTHAITRMIMQDIVNQKPSAFSEGAPQRARNAAKAWLLNSDLKRSELATIPVPRFQTNPVPFTLEDLTNSQSSEKEDSDHSNHSLYFDSCF